MGDTRTERDLLHEEQVVRLKAEVARLRAAVTALFPADYWQEQMRSRATLPDGHHIVVEVTATVGELRALFAALAGEGAS